MPAIANPIGARIAPKASIPPTALEAQLGIPANASAMPCSVDSILISPSLLMSVSWKRRHAASMAVILPASLSE